MSLGEETERPEDERAMHKIRFGDGIWMLVREADLVAGVIRPPS